MIRARVLLLVLLVGCGKVFGPDPTIVEPDAGAGAPCSGPLCAPPEDGDVPGCELITSSGPMGKLVDFQVTTTTQWLLTHAPDSELTTLWENRGNGWVERPLGMACRRGVLAVDSQRRANVACGVPNAVIPDWDMRMFVVDAVQVRSNLIEAARSEYYVEITRGGVPASVVIEPSGQIVVLWASTYRGFVSAAESDYRISRGNSSLWSPSQSVLSVSPVSGYVNDHVRLLMLNGVLHIAFRNTRLLELVIGTVDSDGYNRVVDFGTATLANNGFAFDYEVAMATDGTLHVAIADDTEYSDVAAPGLVFYYKPVGSVDGDEIRVDGVPPYGDGQSGLAGISMALDPAGTPVIGYDHAEGPGKSLRLSVPGPTGWARTDLAPGLKVGESVIRFDADGHGHIAYEVATTGQIEFVDDRCPPAM